MRELADGDPGLAIAKVAYVSDVFAQCPLRVIRRLRDLAGGCPL
jgi:hypothetical protein